MKRVGPRSNILKISAELNSTLCSLGVEKHYLSGDVLFQEGAENAGVFLVRKGKVLLSVRDMPQLNRVFGVGSLLGLPATFTGHSYSLTATAAAGSDVTYVSRELFLQLMHDRPDLCREATDMLGREVTFIQSALAERRRQLAQAS